MKEVIKILVDDHKKISSKIVDLGKFLSVVPEQSFKEIIPVLNFFKEFTFKGHHLRENEVLYAWMRTQNTNADTSVIERIISEHVQLEQLGNKLLNAIISSLAKTPTHSDIVILSDLNDFLSLYIEHIEKEEKFIFMIAEGLQLSKAEEEAMLKRMQDTLS